MIPAAALTPPGKPRLRGVSHLFAFFSAVGAGLVLVVLSPRSLAAATAAYAATLAAMFGVSALYHRPNWRPASRNWMRRLDHCTIFLLVAGTFTPFATLLPAARASSMLALAWSGALLGVVQSLFWVHAPKPLSALLYLALGWSAVAFIPALYQSLGAAPVVLLVLGGILYSGGAVVYALRRPDPSPRVLATTRSSMLWWSERPCATSRQSSRCFAPRCCGPERGLVRFRPQERGPVRWR